MLRRKLHSSKKSSYSHARRVGRKQYTKRMAAPVALGTTMRTTKTRDTNATSNRELVFSVNTQPSSDSYSVVAFAINPGLSSLFPILSRQAQCYTRYKMRFNLEFVSSVGTSAPGNIVMSINRNRSESAPSSLAKQMSMAGAVQSNIWSTACYPTNRSMVRPSEKMLYTRYGSILPGEDINLYDMCNVFVGLTGVDLNLFPPGTSIGQVYLTYQCKFYDQRVEDVIDDNAFTYYDQFDETLLVTDLPDNVEAELGYVLGQGDVVYTGKVGKGPGNILDPGNPTGPHMNYAEQYPGVTLVFPTAGFYLIQQTAQVEITSEFTPAYPIASSAAMPPNPSPFLLQGFGGTYTIDGSGNPQNNSIMDGGQGSGVIISTPIGQGGFPRFHYGGNASDIVITTTQIIQVLSSGTYLVGDNQVVGNGWVSKFIGTTAYSETPYVYGKTSTNEVSIYDYSNGGNYTAKFRNFYIEVTPCDVQTAAYFFPGTWTTDSGVTPLTVLASHKHQAFHGVQQHYRGLAGLINVQSRSLIPSTATSSVVNVQLQSKHEVPIDFLEDKLEHWQKCLTRLLKGKYDDKDKQEIDAKIAKYRREIERRRGDEWSMSSDDDN